MAKKIKKETAIAKPAEEKSLQIFTPSVIQVLKQSIASQLTDPEFKVFAMVCNKYNADPIMKDIVPIPFNTKHGRVLNFITTRNFLLKCAQRSGKFNGLQSELIRNDKGNIIGAKASCWVKGIEHEFKAEVDFKEYYNEKNQEIWSKFPGAMIIKVAEAFVLRRAFSIDLLTEEEISKSSLDALESLELPKTKFTISETGKVKEKEIVEEQKKLPEKEAPKSEKELKDEDKKEKKSKEKVEDPVEADIKKNKGGTRIL